MTTKHTPGPWTYEGTGGMVGGPDRIRVADCNGMERTQEERQANCCLIAAAPGMLEALENIAEAIESPIPERRQKARLQARAAIAKALKGAAA